MKNTENYKLKTCIIVDEESFETLIKSLTDGEVSAQLLGDGDILFETETSCAYMSQHYDEELITNIKEKLSEHFDVNITSFHADVYERPYVWLVYQE